jgi:hypothetical protein
VSLDQCKIRIAIGIVEWFAETIEQSIGCSLLTILKKLQPLCLNQDLPVRDHDEPMSCVEGSDNHEIAGLCTLSVDAALLWIRRLLFLSTYLNLIGNMIALRVLLAIPWI